MKKLYVTLATLLSLTAHAAPKRLVVASGECKDAELSSHAKAFHDTLQSRQAEELLSLAAFNERLFPPASKSFEDIQRQLDAAQNQFYEARYAKAEQAIDEALKEISRLPVGDTRWQLYLNAQLLHALNYRSMGKVKESDTAFLNVLRLKPQHKLDPALYAPSIRQAFDKARGELAKAKKVKLAVRSTVPASDVYLDGLKVGQTPLNLEVLAGAYDITLVKGSAVSFPRQIQAQGSDTPILVDLAYEGSVTASPYPCLAATDRADERTLSHAIRLGGTLGVEEVILVRLERPSSGPNWFAAIVLNVEGGQKVREGGFKTQGFDAPLDSLSALVDFVTTGKDQPPLVVSNTNGKAPWVQSSGAPVSSGPGTPSDPDISAPDRLLEGGEASSRTGSGSTSALRVASYVTLGAGVAALGGAGAVRLMAQKDLDALEQRLNASGRINANDAESLELRDSLASKGNMITGLLIGSGAAITTGAVLFLASPSHEPPPVSVGVSPSPGGASVSLSGSF
ncbi:PEGA domain-containing protein [Hyalangium rubrum]|uniref:PEGA domain-containing protein n=1 Tax=Hyalangium rubrum TaxID=3103134 RepID=A0ABU5HBI1_9BACT|nr:PEGA domain-containing protein [Hyalangium sp. s54d21]MDY7230234.1 PEGA domain-containing protein [Hyalangium sp. s54d21]